ncbi:MAG: hypothetical protein HY064_16585 [Bacteroidetes bacterium]|nr:hypothetical protein [Bacteroidota bacterium]
MLKNSQTPLTTDKYYNDINKMVCDFCNRHKLQLLDIFLIGSRASSNDNTPLTNSDYDSIIMLKDNLGLDDLKKIRDDLQNKINQIDKLDLYHFKFFSLYEFEKAKHYDGFRIFEFQSRFKSQLGTMALNYNSISLDKFNFINSILLQEVNGTLTNPDILKNISNNEKLKKRVERNIQILESKKIIPYCHKTNYIEYCMDNDELYREFKQSKFNKVGYVNFLDKYFMRFRHEFINRGKIYLDNINQLQK